MSHYNKHGLIKGISIIIAIVLVLGFCGAEKIYAGSETNSEMINEDTLEKLLEEADELLVKPDKAAAMEKFKQIVDSCDTVLQSNPDETLLWLANYYKGIALNELGQKGEAEACLKIAENIAKDLIDKRKSVNKKKQAKVYYYLGRIQMQKNDKVKAIEYVKKAFEIGQSNEYSYRLHMDPAFSPIRNTDEYYDLVDMLLMIDESISITTGIKVKDGTPMVECRDIAEPLGAQWIWDEAVKTITIKKFDKTIVMNIESKKAKVNGIEVSLKVAPFLYEKTHKNSDNKSFKIYVPIEFIAKELGQMVSRKDVKVDERYMAPAIVVREDYSRVKYTEEQKKWAVAPAVNIYKYNWGIYNVMGGHDRFCGYVSSSKSTLKKSWGIENREDFFRILEWLKKEGHTRSYRQMEQQLSGENLKLLQVAIDKGEEVPFIFKLYVKNKDKLKDKGLIAWDYCRIVQITGWSYVAGYITIEEAYDICMDACRVIQKTYSSWEDMAEHYIIGYEFWSEEDRNDESTQAYRRNKLNQELLKSKYSPFNTLPWDLNLDKIE